MLVDTVIRNCKVVRPEGTTPGGIAVNNGKIFALASDEDLPDAKRIIDAKGNHIIPGVLDTHVHIGGQAFDCNIRIDTAAGGYGGITTINNMMGFAASAYKDSYTHIFEQWEKVQQENTYTDFVLTLIISSETHLKEIPLYIDKYGVTTFKMMLAYKGREADQKGIIGSDDGTLYSALKQVSACGPPTRLMLHCENIEIINRLISKFKEEDRREDLAAWSDARPSWVESTHIERVASFAKIAKAPIYIVHVSSDLGVNAVAKAKAEGVDIIAETCPHYLTLTKYSPLGTLCKVNPPLRDEASIEKLWEGIRSGVIQCIGSDHCEHMKADKTQTGIWNALPGFPGIENYLPLLLSEGVNTRRITLEKLVEVCCVNNAKAMGIYPRKGAIQKGSDADLVIVDLNKKVKLSAQNLHHVSDFCVYEGMEVRGYPVLTMVRGEIVSSNGEIIAAPSTGHYIRRSLQGHT